MFLWKFTDFFNHIMQVCQLFLFVFIVVVCCCSVHLCTQFRKVLKSTPNHLKKLEESEVEGWVVKTNLLRSQSELPWVVSELRQNRQENCPNLQNPQCTCSISHNITEMCTFLFWMVHCGIRHKWVLGFVRLVYCRSFTHNLTDSI